MPQSATVARALCLITESTGVVPFCKCLTLCTVSVLLGAAREALGGGTGLLLVGEAAAADCESSACLEASDERSAACLTAVEGGGIAAIAQATHRDCSLSPAGNSEILPVLIPCGSRKELDSDSEVEKELE